MEKVSHIVYIKAKPDSGNLVVANPIGADPSVAIKKLGGFNRQKDVGRGLNPEEEKKYLPEIIGVLPTDNAWPSAVKNYWAELNVRIPIEGLKLEIGFWYPNAEDMKTKTNGTPINLSDYILYRFAKEHPRVSPDEENMYNSPKIQFYLFDEAVKKQADLNLLELRMKARTAFVTVNSDETKKRDLLIVLAQELQPDTDVVYHDSMDSITMSLALDKAAEKYPQKFLDMVNDESGVVIGSFIERCIVKGLLKRVPNTNIIMDMDNNTLGNNRLETIAWLKNPVNKTEKDMLKARLEQTK
ncbi:MAG: hypothetical protein JST04_01055 [Bdellovibrionales bacterium]|nr:hypothetical protein [Bdellovibrionales bacterium]